MVLLVHQFFVLICLLLLVLLSVIVSSVFSQVKVVYMHDNNVHRYIC